MERENLNKSLKEILDYEHNYVVPLYQRNYAWGAEEIFQLIQDIYEHFVESPTEHYFIGTLVVLKRKNEDYEVIDGQQRLTTISILGKYLDVNRIKKPKLKYDSRQKVECFFDKFYNNPNSVNIQDDKSIAHFVHAVDYIKSTVLNPKETKPIRLESFKERANYSVFVDYFFNKVILVRVEIPQDTDVAHYFEVMNNRGEQLVPHEILKARLLEKIENKKQAAIFAKVWEACSQMDSYIQSYFNKEDKNYFFGEKKYDGFNFNPLEDQQGEVNEKTFVSINSILKEYELRGDSSDKGTKKANGKYNSIIDFPNFLMHIFKLKYKDYDGREVPLSGDELLRVFEALEGEIDPMDFIKDLFFYRVVFDRFVLKTVEDEKVEDNYKWVLRKPAYYFYDTKEQDRLVLKNTFEKREEQDAIIKCLSMLQVTFRTKKYKKWLQEVFQWFREVKDLEISGEEYLKKLNAYVLAVFSENERLVDICTNKTPNVDYAEGTNTPHFLFNFIDYLLWMDKPKDFNFDFKYRNSVEHHLPQSLENAGFVHSLGNLCLVSKRANSRMGNENAVGKAKETNGKYYKEDLPPKQKLIYDKTNKGSCWGEVEIKAHYDEIVKVLKGRNKILEHHER
ncbi:DUF262 domain-containing protein [Aureispira sp. CCB-E]|uniref:DUF262 domain-containing protein n=1 Tax=Aureispira sp. CCB-E TaxID=3051121 RepID=UPI0028686459|nr:DUF262 domain-containing protein [Aureispira sp. CCB-E]WMX17027.1 DUF262 domain-containing protein [Aureispira sp. CCB-E]